MRRKKNEKFKIGDRVAVYESGVRGIGKIINSNFGSLTLKADIFAPANIISVHPKQCRLLKNKKKSNIEVKVDYSYYASESLLDDGWKLISTSCKPGMDGFVFFYTRKKK